MEQKFAVLTASDIQVGTHSVHRIPFVTPIDTARDVSKLQQDGLLLPTVIFQWIYISQAHDYAVIKPW